jgi:hypothetical protein
VDGAWWWSQVAEMRGNGRCGRLHGASVQSQLPSSGDQAGTLPLGGKHTRPGANTKRCFSSGASAPPRPSLRLARGVASQSCCKFAGGSGSRWWLVYATLASSGVASGVVGSLPSYLIRLSRWRSSWVNLMPLVAFVM